MHFDIDDNGKFVLRDGHRGPVVQRGNMQEIEDALDHQENQQRQNQQRIRRYKCCKRIRSWFRRKRAA